MNFGPRRVSASFALSMDVRRISEDRFDEIMRDDSRFDHESVFFVSEIFFNRMVDLYPNNFFLNSILLLSLRERISSS